MSEVGSFQGPNDAFDVSRQRLANFDAKTTRIRKVQTSDPDLVNGSLGDSDGQCRVRSC